MFEPCDKRSLLNRLARLSLPLAAAGCAAEHSVTTAPSTAELREQHTAPSFAHEPHLSPIPAALAVPAEQQLAFQLHARGAQLYGCQAGSSGAFAWALVAPDAQLFDDNGQLAGKHYAGPTWESIDGSSVVAAKVASADGAAGAVPWLLLRAAAHSADGVLSTVSYVQRIDTDGGVAPKDGCDQSHDGQTVRVPYTANYAFYHPQPQ
jgi:hypothetical protein